MVSKIIFLRDLELNFYVDGINNNVNSIDSIVNFLRKETEGLDVVVVGYSAGGYMATICGLKMSNVKRVYSFGGIYNLYSWRGSHLETSFSLNNGLVANQTYFEKEKYYNLIPSLKTFSRDVFYHFYSNESESDLRVLDEIKLNSATKNLHLIALDSKKHGGQLSYYDYVGLMSKSITKKLSFKNGVYTKTEISIKCQGVFFYIINAIKSKLHKLRKKRMNKLEKECAKILSNCDLKSVPDAFDNSKETFVTVNVETYNHDKYLRKCLDSILCQKVDFNVIINIHDDASTDSTKSIIEEYKNKYPNIIFPLFQKKNIYTNTKNFNDIFKVQGLRAKGKYVANCEGDDYWTDEYKLKIQSTLMDAHPNCHLCVHKVEKINNNSNETICLMPGFNLKTGLLKSKQFISFILEKYSFQTSSYFFRTDDTITFYSDFPEFARVLTVADDAMLMYFGQLGPVIYIDRNMSVYRKFSEGSWSIAHRNYTNQEQERVSDARIKSLELYDKYTNFVFHNDCIKRIYRVKISNYLRDKDYDKILKNKAMKRFFRRRYFFAYLSVVHPNIYNFLRRNKK